MLHRPIQKFIKNEHGRDLFATDIHGCFEILRELLDCISFDETKDRLFLGGDLVDRGPQSLEVLEWLQKHWVHSVLGNHEQMCMRSGVSGSKKSHTDYGGEWFCSLGKSERRNIINEFRKLPFAIEVEGKDGRRFGIVHAECPFDDWALFLTALQNTPSAWVMGTKMIETALWGWNKYRLGDTSEIKHLDVLFVGHTALTMPAKLANVRYMDTGVCFKGGHLTITDMNTEETYDSRLLDFD